MDGIKSRNVKKNMINFNPDKQRKTRDIPANTNNQQ